MRPLDRLTSLKAKLSVVIVAAVAVSALVSTAGERLGVPLLLRPVIAMALALALVQVLARGLTSPLRELAAAATAVARGEHGRQVRAASRDEVGEAARAFNAMAAELAAVDRVRRDLVANVSHELRTPIATLQATLENLVDGVSAADPETLRVMLRQVERLGRLVAQLLDLSRLESGVVPFERRAFAVRPLLDDAASEARLQSADVAVVVAAPGDLCAEGDPERVHQVVANLLENAVRHSPTGSTVALSARPRRAGPSAPGGVVIEVCDEGPGIPPDEADRVFERFYRADAARASGHGGAGLGLAIARWIVDQHGGEIRAEPRSPSGCRMVVVLPGATA